MLKPNRTTTETATQTRIRADMDEAQAAKRAHEMQIAAAHRCPTGGTKASVQIAPAQQYGYVKGGG
jgi:hypothetical protein